MANMIHASRQHRVMSCIIQGAGDAQVGFKKITALILDVTAQTSVGGGRLKPRKPHSTPLDLYPMVRYGPGLAFWRQTALQKGSIQLFACAAIRPPPEGPRQAVMPVRIILVQSAIFFEIDARTGPMACLRTVRTGCMTPIRSRRDAAYPPYISRDILRDERC
jgi:hypothetical protein